MAKKEATATQGDAEESKKAPSAKKTATAKRKAAAKPAAAGTKRKTAAKKEEPAAPVEAVDDETTLDDDDQDMPAELDELDEDLDDEPAEDDMDEESSDENDMDESDADDEEDDAEAEKPEPPKAKGAFVVRDDDDDDNLTPSGNPKRRVIAAGATADPVKDYLKQIGRVSLLNAEQEVDLSERIEAGLYAQHLLDTESEGMDFKRKRELKWAANDGKKANKKSRFDLKRTNNKLLEIE